MLVGRLEEPILHSVFTLPTLINLSLPELCLLGIPIRGGAVYPVSDLP